MKTYLQVVAFFDNKLVIKASEKHLLAITLASNGLAEKPNQVTKYVASWLKAYEKKKFFPFDQSYLFFENSNSSNVYKELLNVRVGETISYKNLALKAKLPNAYRFVGSTMAKNKIPLVIPCHRVLKSDGLLGNYSLIGPAFKVFLLNHEKDQQSK